MDALEKRLQLYSDFCHLAATKVKCCEGRSEAISTLDLGKGFTWADLFQHIYIFAYYFTTDPAHDHFQYKCFLVQYSGILGKQRENLGV